MARGATVARADPVAGNDQQQTFLFADLSGFTALTEAHGDEEAADLVAHFGAAAGGLAVQHDAVVVKSIGDALMIRAEDPANAVRLGAAMVDEIGRQHGFPIVRVGMHTGSAVEREGDWFGRTVNLAARVSGVASGGDVLLTGATRAGAGTVEGIELRPRGRQTLKNVAAPVELFVAVPQGARDPVGLPIDPVCRMAVDPAHCAGSLIYAGVEYHFCSLRCAAAFAGDPERHVAGAGPTRGGS